jgi:hypothetical protein
MAASDVGRNKSARRQQGRMFPALGAPETPVLRLTRGQAYSGLRRDVYNNECAAWERDNYFNPSKYVANHDNH